MAPGAELQPGDHGRGTALRTVAQLEPINTQDTHHRSPRLAPVKNIETTRELEQGVIQHDDREEQIADNP